MCGFYNFFLLISESQILYKKGQHKKEIFVWSNNK